MSCRSLRVSLFACALLTSVEASAVTIDLEGYVDTTVLGVVVDSGATFTPVGGADFSISAFAQPTWGTAAPQILCPRLAGSGACESDFSVDFATDVTGLRFYFTGDDSASGITVSAFRDGVPLGVFVSPLSDGNPFTAHLVDLAAAFGGAAIDRIVVDELGDVQGLGYDDFSFEASAVPEPASIALFGSGLFALAARRRRRS